MTKQEAIELLKQKTQFSHEELAEIIKALESPDTNEYPTWSSSDNCSEYEYGWNSSDCTI